MKRLLIIVVIILIGLFFSCNFIVPEGNYALQFSSSANDKPKLLEPGLHFKWPFVEKVLYGSNQTQLLKADGSTENPFLSTQTFDKRNLEMGYALLWQVTDPKTFYQANLNHSVLTNTTAALNKELNNAIAQLTLAQLLQGDKQQALTADILNKINPSLSAEGIKLTALMITSINSANVDRTAWTSQMKTQQESQLNQLRQESSTLSQALKAETDDKVLAIITQGTTQSEKIRSQADLDATQIYADAYNKDPNFYEFFHNLQLYKKVLSNKQDVLILSTHTDFFKSLSPNFHKQDTDTP